jgi:very-short-patch-repair endonuclease
MRDEPDFDHAIGGKSQVRDDEVIAELAERQYGVVAWLKRSPLDGRSTCLRARHRAQPPPGRRSLANRQGFGSVRGEVPTARRSPEGIRVHEAHLPADETTTHQGIPITTVPRTLFDLATVLSPRQLERAIDEAEVLRLWDELSLDRLLDRYPRHRGNRAIRAALHQRRRGATVTRSELEETFLRLIDAAGLPRPDVNALVEGFEVDAVWRDAGLVVELDGRYTQGTAAAFETDRQRDRTLQVAGRRPVRVTYRQLRDTPREVAADLRRLLAAATLAA